MIGHSLARGLRGLLLANSTPTGAPAGGNRRLASAALLLALAASGCAATGTMMVPARHVRGTSPDKAYSATTYGVLEGAQRIGEAKLWSGGAVRETIDGKTETLVQVGFLIANHSDAPIRFDSGRLRLVDVVAGPRNPFSVPALRVEGTPVVAPESSEQLTVSFRLPQGTWPGDVIAYQVEWALEGDTGGVERTAFVARSYQRDSYAVYYNGHYTPHFYGAAPFYGPYRYWGPSWRGAGGYGYYASPRPIVLRNGWR